MSAITSADVNLIRLGITTIQLCQELSLKQRVVGSAVVAQECKNYEETKDWSFSASFEDAIASFNSNQPAPVASPVVAAAA